MEYVHEERQLCVGCGVCAGVCNVITMRTDVYGQYYPVVNEEKCVHCGKCVSLCPMRIDEKDKGRLNQQCWESETEHYKPETGYYLGTYEGFIPEYRNTSASGGFCTALLCELLNRGLVQSVYCAWKNEDYNKFFISKRVISSDELIKSSGSAYYPIEISETLRSIRRDKEKTAIVCLPCQATAIRLAMKRDKVLRESICYIIGLVCGGMPGKGMVEYIAADLNCDLTKTTKLTFREKDKGIRCNNCQIKLYAGKEEKLVSRFHNGESFGFVYLNHILHNKGCNTCTDIYAEQADAVFGDAWFDENKPNELGTSICITRNRVLDQIMKEIGTKESTIERMILAQKNVGLIGTKKRLSYCYREYYKNSGYTVGESSQFSVPIKKYIRVMLKEQFAEANRRYWRQYKAGSIPFQKLKKKWYRNISWKRRLKL